MWTRGENILWALGGGKIDGKLSQHPSFSMQLVHLATELLPIFSGWNLKWSSKKKNEGNCNNFSFLVSFRLCLFCKQRLHLRTFFHFVFGVHRHHENFHRRHNTNKHFSCVFPPRNENLDLWVELVCLQMFQFMPETISSFRRGAKKNVQIR